MVLTGAAAAGVVATRLSQDPPSDTDKGDPADQKVPAAAQPAAESRKKTTLPEPTTEAAPESADTPTAAPAPKAATPSKSTPPASAKETYRAANDARRAGKTSEAILGYRKLQRNFPASPEAHASRVSLGGLLLRSGSSSAALAQFNAYLASSGGQLIAEALFGRAQALRALGRATEEAQNLERLVTTYPNSAYASHAQRRLLELR
jgi:TolA-binding protein